MIRVTQQGNPNNIRLVGTKMASTDNLPLPRRTSEYVTRKGAVYINEFPKGRELTFRYHPHGRATYDWGVVTRNERTPLQGSGTWTCEPHMDNISEAIIDRAYHATCPGTHHSKQVRVGGQNRARVRYVQKGGREYRLTTSGCGLDQYKVTFTYRRGSLDYTDAVKITVRKRLNCHYVVMQNVVRAPRTIRWVAGEYAKNFGIDLAVPTNNAGQYAPPQTIPHQAPIAEQALRAALPGYANRGPQDLWIAVVDTLVGGFLGWGGSGVVAVGMQWFGQERLRLRGIKNQWDNWPSRNMDNWLDAPAAGGQLLTPQQRRLYKFVAQGNGDLLVKNMIKNAFLHEVGHALGLVPGVNRNHEAGGRQQGQWYDTNAQHTPNHCTDSSCTMWWEADSSGAMPPLTKSHRSFDGYSYGRPDEDCALYLAACNLSDIRNYP